MKKIVLSGLVLCSGLMAQAQSIDKIITVNKVTAVETVLAADDMQGRRAFTPGIDKASAYIESEFKKIGLQTFNGAKDYRQEFSMTEAKRTGLEVTIDGKKIDSGSMISFSYQAEVSFTESSPIAVVNIRAGDAFGPKFYEYYQSDKNLLVLVDNSFKRALGNMMHMNQMAANPGKNTVVFVFGPVEANHFTIEATNTITTSKLNNVVGLLKGKSKPNEYVIFSGHYDHLGIGSPEEGQPHDAKDSIYNGANDDAAGTTAVILLADYFKKMNNNERSIIFTAFVAEELGGYGAKYFSKQLDPEQVMAMFNLEMIGTESKWGRNSAYITGFDKSSMGEILQKNLEGSQFKFHPDPYPEQQLFYRSDNATLARLGVPAHTISTSKMDNEPNYHKASDEIGTLDMNNMTEIIKAIAISSSTIISGKDTPTRVDTAKLK
ncbi:M28 family peptidase [Flavobacterium muglaense]|uniref:M28 family peptidase n=1 Tax=Flavobacterium muglaense TaxID=2764716 RepID=A0A923SGZ5_9FLAO|nr:M28 family peptidase [Flavobacterium muglaense]MBC5839697.1 M28 family peptidase [Flavobacterium muglaense]MBC5846236.1 M28 family peptidase [Flavobacterium muglaense]